MPIDTLNWRAVGSVLLAFSLSFVNLAGALLAIGALGGLEPWSDRQFVGLFGFGELSIGIAYTVAPNIWRLPVAEANMSERTTIKLAASTLLIPHWIAAAKLLSGVLMLTYAAAKGLGPASVGLPLAVAFLSGGFLALCLIAARLGVAHPDLDVFFIVVKRPAHKDQDLPGLSFSGVLMQALSNLGVFPTVALTSPAIFYRPEIGPSPAFLLVTGLAFAFFAALAWLCWRGRITWRAPREQQREAERSSPQRPEGLRPAPVHPAASLRLFPKSVLRLPPPQPDSVIRSPFADYNSRPTTPAT
ncbi:MAG: hypothetical protein E6I03_04620 [Chloroflexi bacterium]|nr:MAG: hypothetical protein E6I03_04620 [Chloroflexota bacterium]